MMKIKFANKDELEWVMDSFIEDIHNRYLYSSQAVKDAQEIYDRIIKQIK